MSRKIFSIENISGGLNNQKMAILGLTLCAERQGGVVSMPKVVCDWTPTASGPRRLPLPLGDVLNAPLLHETLMATSSDANEAIPYITCFETGAQQIRSESDYSAMEVMRNRTATILAAMRPCAEIQTEVDRILKVLPQDTIAVQLRVERDWHQHIRKKLAANSGIDRGREIILDPARIFDKICAQPDLNGASTLLVCCDEDDLIDSREHIASLADARGFKAIFKSQISDAFPESRLKRSVVDFSICCELERYVGLSMSTFSNMLCMTKTHDLGTFPFHYIYDAEGDQVLRRYDCGRAVAPNAITKHGQ